MRLYKKLSALFLAAIIGAGGAASGIPALDLVAFADYRMADGAYRMLDGTAINGVYARGIDISHWQGEIDWKAVAADDVRFVMHGTRYAGNVDPYFEKNAKAATDAGLDLGVYIYSYATNVEMAEAEADFVLSLIKDYKISYPVAFDMEDNVQANLSKDELAAMANAFCRKIEDAGYYPIIYANDYWLANKLDMSQIPYPVWVARYQQLHTYQNPVMWQATSSGQINGVKGNVDIDFQYTDFSSHLPANLWRTIFGTTYYYQDHQLAKDTWINDGNAAYYIQSDGTAYHGWRKDNNIYYMLDNNTGKLVTGWYPENNQWYYLSLSDGGMATGWQLINDQWYYLAPSSGAMQTGWLNTGNKTYYLRDNGSMVNGWRQIDSSWYYFTPGDGNMNTGGWLNDNGTWYFLNQDGTMHTGLLDQNGTLYYLDSASGAMYADTAVTIGETTYQAGSDGSLTIPAESEPQTEASPETAPDPAAGTGQSEPIQVAPLVTKPSGPGL